MREIILKLDAGSGMGFIAYYEILMQTGASGFVCLFVCFCVCVFFLM